MNKYKGPWTITSEQKNSYQFIKSWDKTKKPAEAGVCYAGPVNCNPNVETEIQINRALDDNHEDKTNKNYSHYRTE